MASSPPSSSSPPQILSVLPRQQTEPLSNQFKIYLWSDSDSKKRIEWGFFSPSRQLKTFRTRSVPSPID